MLVTIFLILMVCYVSKHHGFVHKTRQHPIQKKTYVRLLQYIKGNGMKFVVAFGCILFVVFVDLIQSVMIGKITDILTADTIQYQWIIIIIVVYIGILLASAAVQYLETMLLQKAGQHIIYRIREDVFVKIEGLAIGQLNQVPVGKLVTRVTSDTNAINDMYTNIIINLLRNGLTIVGALIIMFTVNVELTCYVLVITPFMILFSAIFGKYSKKAHRAVRKSISDVNASLSENISGIKITQGFQQEAKQFQSFEHKNLVFKHYSLKQIFIFGIFRPSIYVLYILTVVVVLYMGGKRMMASEFLLDLSVIVIFYQLIERFFNPIQQLAEQFNVLQSALAASERIFEIIDKQPVIVDAEDAIELPELKGEIEFKNVWFAYEKADWILRDVSFKVNPKETVAFVGATGSGKTTILSLIVRNYDIQKGQILIDGQDIKTIQIASLRKQIGQMLQDVFLFSGTIASNITLRDENITSEEIKAACQFVNAEKIIDKLPNRYEEEVKERGNNFSAGERQLLSFARVIAHKPNILILDEATANIDTETEVLIQDSLKKMMNVGTMLMVAHRLSTIQHADKIIVLHKGVIIEMGNHQQLLKQNGQYYRLYQLQYQHQTQNVTV